MAWTAAASAIAPGPVWLSVSPASGSSVAGSPPPSVELRVNTAGLPAGEYYGQVVVTAPDADDSPQIVSVVLAVLPAGTNLPPVVQPTGLVFTGVAGQSPPASQSLLSSTDRPFTFSSAH